MQTLRFWRALVATVLKASIALRGAFLLQVVFMAANNLMFLSTWWILFQRFDDVAGYRMPDMLLVFGLSACGYGFGVAFFGGAQTLAQNIVDGNLDALLTQPKSVLVRALSSRSVASGWGDLASGVLMLALSGYLTPTRTPLVLLAVALAALVLLSFAVLLHSAAFWASGVESVSTNVFHYLVAFTLYPPTLFSGGAKLLLFTLLPAGLAAYLPVELVRNFDVRTALLATGGALAYAALAAWVFARGLRRYAGGSRFGALG